MDGEDSFLELLRNGSLIPVEFIFTQDEDGFGYNLSDKTGAESDCFRAEKWLLRPSDDIMNDSWYIEEWNKIVSKRRND